MASYNKVILIGHLGDNPVVREHGGRKVANFSLAVNAYTRPGEPEKTDWFRVSFWGNIANVAEKYLKKGSQVYVEGRLSISTYKDSNGVMRFSLDVNGQNLTLLGSKDHEPSTQVQTTQNPVSAQPVAAGFPDSDNGFDDLPF